MSTLHRDTDQHDRGIVFTKGAPAHLDAKTRELIAIVVGLTRQCDGCITTHVHAAKKQGASAEEIAEALGVAIAVNAGAALVFSARAMDAVVGESPEQH